MEPAAAQTTYCRRCSKHIDLEKLQAGAPPEAKRNFFLEKIGALFGGARTKTVPCRKCAATQEVDNLTKSIICPGCGSYMDLRDFKISASHSCNIHTEGFVEVTAKGELNCQKIICSEAIIRGQIHGRLICDVLRMKHKGMLFCEIEAAQLIVEKGADTELARVVKAGNAQINGRFSARLICEGKVTVGRRGRLEGTVYAKSINVEQGGVFQGELFIGPKEWAQPDLLPQSEGASNIIELTKRSPRAFRQAG